jgi:hypothetical protein
VKRVVHAGVSDFLLKPLTRSGTQQRLMQIIARLRNREVAPTPSAKPRAGGFTPTEDATILVADPAEDFRDFCRHTLGHRFTVIEAKNGVEAYHVALKQTPTAILIGRGLALLGSDALANKLRVAAKRPMTILAIAPKSEIATLQAAGLYDGCLVKTFVPDLFERALDTLGLAASPLARLNAKVPELRPTVISATEQVFGMLVKMDVELVGDHQPPFAGSVLAGRIPLTVADEIDIDLDLTCTEDSANVFAVAMCGAPEPQGVLPELANIVAGRIKHAIGARKLTTTMGLPRIERIDANVSRRPPELSTRFGVIGTTNQLDVSLSVRERARTATAVAAPRSVR